MKKGVSSIMQRRKSTALAVIMASTVLMTACGSKEYLKDIKASDYVTLGNYIGVEASAEEPTVKEGLDEMYLEYYILPNCATTVEVGDTAVIDFVGYLDGEAFEGGTGSNYNLTIGSHQFIDGFEDGLVGVNIGDTVSLDLFFPDPYLPNTDLSGAPVVFDVTVKGLYMRPIPEDMSDEYVQALGIEGVSTVKELWDYAYNDLYETAVQNYENTIESVLTNTIMSDSTFKEPPSEMVDRYCQNIKDTLTAQASMLSATLDEYMLYYYGLDAAGAEEKFRADALTRAQQYIMYQAIADAEGLNPTEEQIQEEITSRVEAYNYESEEAYREDTDVEMLREQLMRRNVMEFLKENGNIMMTSTIED